MMEELNLFGETENEYEKFRRLNKYGLSEYKYKTCRQCIHQVRTFYKHQIFFKCNLMGISASEETDIRLDYSCDKWKGEGFI